ncbi:hypothetical protein COCOR_01801 [Corallococcus coralloides DSM 2259]|uniref:VWFA domain-containing protein n=1 Tax=Corallococcus coralloides (strain ATCC 25202 / DSM 2259 / NBRC 100086 / M2) TaxID=1144275 RepID=H8N1J3_CORCM|nr:VWA domain-containing protein [Corallococcus coralloides]AFE04296.1 hypothetical protein COCOR_01801 [Corallococcus coralloides DSM 2259]
MLPRIASRLARRAGLVMTLLTGGAAQAYTEEHVIVLIDRSGSMLTTRGSGLTRFEEALSLARNYVGLANDLPRKFAVWTFEGTGYIKEQGFSDEATTLQTLNRLTVGLGTTPLAHAVCDAADELLWFEPGVDARKRVHLISDGEENNSPVSAPCYGPPSTTRYPALEQDSWQWKVRNMLKTGDPLRDSETSYALVLDANVFHNYLTLAPQAAQALPPFLALLEGLARESGGVYTDISDARPLPYPGDADQSGCVDMTDFYFVLEHYGLSVPPAPPRADINQDGVVDLTDYNIVLNNMGTGCAASVRK